MQTVIKFLKIREVKTPQRNETDAGIDFFVPEFTKSFIDDFYNKNSKSYISSADKGRCIFIPKNCSVNIPSGIKVNFDQKLTPNIALIAFNKSGVSTKKYLKVGACVVDHSYQGEVHINLFNDSNEDIYLYEGEKAVQFLEIPVVVSHIETYSSFENDENFISNEDFYPTVSYRGEDGFGSTNKEANDGK